MRVKNLLLFMWLITYAFSICAKGADSDPFGNISNTRFVTIEKVSICEPSSEMPCAVKAVLRTHEQDDAEADIASATLHTKERIKG